MLHGRIRALLRALFVSVSACATVLGQTPASAGGGVPKHAFEIVSIHPSSPSGPQSTTWGITADGYRTSGQSIWSTIMIAYFPQGLAYWTSDRLSGTPSWINDPFDITAKVSEADLPAWQKQGLGLDKVPLLSEMLQSMLADRCKLVFHRVPGEASGFALVRGKHGEHLAASAQGAALPTGMKLGSGGVAVASPRGERLTWTFHSATMADLEWFLSTGSSGHPVIDKTGLTGRYDFVLACAEFDPDHPNAGCGAPISDRWDLDSLGLHLEPIKLSADTLVIDHIEKPSDN